MTFWEALGYLVSTFLVAAGLVYIGSVVLRVLWELAKEPWSKKK